MTPTETFLKPVDFAQRMRISLRQAQVIFYQTHTNKTVKVGKRRRMKESTFEKVFLKEI